MTKDQTLQNYASRVRIVASNNARIESVLLPSLYRRSEDQIECWRHCFSDSMEKVSMNLFNFDTFTICARYWLFGRNYKICPRARVALPTERLVSSTLCTGGT
jgi:hypothetical protein